MKGAFPTRNVHADGAVWFVFARQSDFVSTCHASCCCALADAQLCRHVACDRRLHAPRLACARSGGKHDVHELTVKVVAHACEVKGPECEKEYWFDGMQGPCWRERAQEPLYASANLAHPDILRRCPAECPDILMMFLTCCRSAHRRCCTAILQSRGRPAATPRSLPRYVKQTLV